jgi:hypothetical protein
VKPIDWAGMMQRWKLALVPESLRHDFEHVLEFAQAQYRENQRLNGALEDARRTIMAACILNEGSLEVPFSMVESFAAGDSLDKIDFETDEGERIRKFSYVPFPAAVTRQ